MNESKNEVIAGFNLKAGDDGWGFYLTRTDVNNSKMFEVICKKSKWYDKIWNLAEEFGTKKEKDKYWLSVSIQTKAYLVFLRLNEKHYKVYTPNEREVNFVFTADKEVVKDFRGRWVYKTQ